MKVLLINTHLENADHILWDGIFPFSVKGHLILKKNNQMFLQDKKQSWLPLNRHKLCVGVLMNVLRLIAEVKRLKEWFATLETDFLKEN